MKVFFHLVLFSELTILALKLRGSGLIKWTKSNMLQSRLKFPRFKGVFFVVDEGKKKKTVNTECRAPPHSRVSHFLIKRRAAIWRWAAWPPTPGGLFFIACCFCQWPCLHARRRLQSYSGFTCERNIHHRPGLSSVICPICNTRWCTGPIGIVAPAGSLNADQIASVRLPRASAQGLQPH